MAAMIDEHDRRLLSHVRPPEFRNPTPARRYDLVVIGGGTAGLVCAAGAAGLGARVALVEQERLGGDCLNTGCIPSKALLRSAHVMGEARLGASLGVVASATPDFAAVMARLHARRADLAPHDSAARLASLGVDVFFGTARFSGPRAVTVERNDPNDPSDPNGPNDWVLRFRKAVIATGSRPAVPRIPGLADTPFLTSETLFDLVDQPRTLIVIGAGPIGCEMAQAFARLGTKVTLIESGPQVLPREDGDAAAHLTARLLGDGVEVLLTASITSATWAAARFTLTVDGRSVSADAVLVAAGRKPGIDGLALEAAGVAYGLEGVTVDDRLRTSNRRIYAAGDVCSRYKFTHAADAMARIVIQNALFFGRRRASALIVPWCTFTSPEVAHVGLVASEAAAIGAATVTIPLSEVDRAVVDESADGFVRLHQVRGQIVGATIVAPGAGELVSTVALAMQHKQGLADFAAAVFPYPTVSLALRQAGDAHRRSGLTPSVRTVLRYYFRAFR
jgi:pyruvate/2-oxoglutarate dehydrogenase complex dihydrolipoamide dehydrogenase (E3) component